MSLINGKIGNFRKKKKKAEAFLNFFVNLEFGDVY